MRHKTLPPPEPVHPAGTPPGTGRRASSRRAAPAGFTLIELLVVIAILALLASIAGPEIFKRLGGAKSNAAGVQIENLAAGIDLYKLEVGEWPPDLEALVTRPPGVERWNGPYLRKQSVPKDPWGNPYLYRVPGDHGPYDLYSLGADNAEGGEGEDADIVSWK